MSELWNRLTRAFGNLSSRERSLVAGAGFLAAATVVYLGAVVPVLAVGGDASARLDAAETEYEVVKRLRGDYDGVVERLLPVRYSLPIIGGSHAQRDLFHQILIAAALRAPRPAVARALLGERTRLKPENAWSWQRYAQALKATGDDAAARVASDQARALLAA